MKKPQRGKCYKILFLTEGYFIHILRWNRSILTWLDAEEFLSNPVSGYTFCNNDLSVIDKYHHRFASEDPEDLDNPVRNRNNYRRIEFEIVEIT